jgi:hypothetical protein
MPAITEHNDSIVFEAQHSRMFEEGATFTLHEGGIIVSVAEEKAVDSYNQSFECSLTMSREQALQLCAWLNKNFRDVSEKAL